MNHVSLLQKLAPLGVAAIGAIAATGIATAPAQAFVFKDGSTLNWADSTGDFYQDYVQTIGNPGSTFNVDFNPFGPNVIVNTSTGSFDNPPSDLIENSTTPLENQVPFSGTFELLESGRYKLVNTLVWDFGSTTLMDHDGNSVTSNLSWVLPGDNDSNGQGPVEFAVAFEAGQAVEFDLCLDSCVDVPYFVFNGQAYYGQEIMGEFQDTVQNRFQFDDSASEGGGNYEAGGVVVKGAPEPASVLGLLTFAGLGLGLKRKQQA